MKKALQGIIFDHDGTLVDTESGHFQVWCEVLSRYDVTLSEDDYIVHCNGIPSIENADYLVERYQLDLSPQVLADEKEHATVEYFAKNTCALMPGVETTVTAFAKAQYRLGIATGANLDTVKRCLAHMPLFRHFETVASSDQVARRKPAPDVYQLALTRLGLHPDNALAIEDSPTGIASAKNAGLRCVAVPNRYSMRQDLSAADYRIDTLDQLKALIDDIQR